MKIIKTLLILSIAVALQTTASASSFFGKTIRPSGDVVTKAYDIPSSSYTKMDVSNTANVRIVEGSGDIVVKIDSNLEPYLVIEVSNGKLEIKLDGNLRLRGGFTFDVVVPSKGRLERISASAGADIVSEIVLAGDNLELISSSGSEIDVITSGDNCTARASSGSGISLDCKSEILRVKTSSGAGIVVDLVSDRCEASSSSGSNITLRGTANQVDLSASSGSGIYARDLTYKTSSISKSSGGNVRLEEK